MARRADARKHEQTSGSLATGWGSASVVELPLLPYERQLIKQLGCTIEEYEHYRKSLINYGNRRPAAYAHIPDIRCEPVSIVVSLVVGIVLSAVSALLAPKPEKREKQEDKRKKLADDVSQTRFNTTQGFDATQEIARLGSPVPLFFGNYQPNDGNSPTGGLSIAPQMVWSQMYSYGNHQGFKALYVVGEVLETAGDYPRKDKPDLAGIQIGTVPLSTLPKEQYAVYWASNFPENRIKKKHLIYGTAGQPASGDPTIHDDVFNCQIENEQAGPGFCMSSSPNGDTSFGVYSPIRNGTGWRLNFRIVPYPRNKKRPDNAENRILAERSLIAGKENRVRWKGMRGVGAGWSPMMGIYSINGQSPDEPRRDVRVKVGDEIEFKIRGEAATKDRFGWAMFDFDRSDDVDGDDIRNRLISMRSEADSALQVGSLFMIGRTVWQVQRRNGGSQGVWNEGEADMNVTLKCVELTTNDNASIIGVAGGRTMALDPRLFQVWDGYLPSAPSKGWVGPGFWPLLNVSFTVIKNTRPVSATEFGIKSQVWNQASGLCNFASLISAKTLAKYEDDEYSIDNGTITRYFARSSCFTIYLRPVGADSEGNPFEWAFLGQSFVVTGDSPVDQFNYIRLKSKEGPKQMEFRFIPRAFSDINSWSRDANLWRLNARSGQEIGADFATHYGVFRLTICGDIVKAEPLFKNPELISGKRPGLTTSSKEVTAVERTGWWPSSPTAGREHAFWYETFGWPGDHRDQERNAEADAKTPTGKTVRLRFRVRSEWAPWEEFRIKYHSNYHWSIRGIDVVRSDSDINNGERLEIRIDSIKITGGNIWARLNGLNKVGMDLKVTNTDIVIRVEPGEEERLFESTSQMSELSLYDEIAKSCDSGPEHSVTYVNESVSTEVSSEGSNEKGAPYPFTMIGVALRSNTLLTTVNQLRIWLANGQSVKYNDPAQAALRGPSNNFADIVNYILTNEVGGLGSAAGSALVDYTSLSNAARFIRQNGLTFDGSIADRVNARSYLTEIAPFFLCNFVIGNGLFSMQPSLPHDSNGTIDPQSIPISNYFNERTIIDGSYKLSYLDSSQRRDFKALVSYRVGFRDSTPSIKTVSVRWNEDGGWLYPQEEIDLSDFCTSEEHALKVGRFLLSLRRNVDHSVQFETLPNQLGLSPGAYIVVQTTVSPQASRINGAIHPETGEILATENIDDGKHDLTVYKPGADVTEVIEVEIKDHRAVDQSLHGAVFSSLIPREEQNLYQVEQVELTEEGLAQITASHFPAVRVGSRWQSIVAEDVLDKSGNRFKVDR